MIDVVNTVASILRENMLGYLSLEIISSAKLTIFLELRSRETVRFSEQIMCADKYPNIFPRKIGAHCSYTRRCFLCHRDDFKNIVVGHGTVMFISRTVFSPRA